MSSSKASSWALSPAWPGVSRTERSPATADAEMGLGAQATPGTTQSVIIGFGP
jgi:hypothetical protein